MELQLHAIDIIIFAVFIVGVVAVGLWMSRGEHDSEDYFLAGRKLTWWLIGFSLIAANISAEQFVGMSGQAAKDSIGLAVASYEWIAAISLVAVAFFFLPTFLKSGIFTIPQYLEYRFTHSARTFMSLLMVVIYIGVTIASVIYMGAKALDPLLHGQIGGMTVGITALSWAVGISAAIYVAAGGLKACAWADLIQGSALIIGGAVIMVLAFMALDNPEQYEGVNEVAVTESLDLPDDASLGDKFMELKKEKMHMVLPFDSDFLPWTALMFGIWIPNLYYWGLNQYIMQRTLGASSLAEGQKGVAFAAALKLIIPFIVCVPGIIAFSLYSEKMTENAMNDATLNKPALDLFADVEKDPSAAKVVFPFNEDFAQVKPELAQRIFTYNQAVTEVSSPGGDALAEQNDDVISKGMAADKALEKETTLVGYDYDGAFPLLIRYLTPVGLRGFVVAALMGAVISSLASMLNAASTIFTMDIYREWINPNASQTALIWVGRSVVVVAVLLGCAIAPQLANPEFSGAFAYIQEFQGFVSPGILTIFLFGLFLPRTPRLAGLVGLILSPVIYGFLYLFFGDMAFLNRMAITVVSIAVVLGIMTLVMPLKEPITLPEQTKIEMKWSPTAVVSGIAVVIATVVLYVIFW
jgi:SSS family solute:Na+ symporter